MVTALKDVTRVISSKTLSGFRNATEVSGGYLSLQLFGAVPGILQLNGPTFVVEWFYAMLLKFRFVNVVII